MSTSFSITDLYAVKGYTVVVTGGGTGLGKAIASAFVANGAKVFISGRRKEVLDKAVTEMNAQASQGGSAIAVPGDVGSKAGCKKLYDDVAAQTKVVSGHHKSFVFC